MASELTIAEAHLVAKKAETVIAEALIWAKSIDVDLELHGSSGSSTFNSTLISDATPSTLYPSNSKPLSTVSTNSSAVERDGIPLQKSVNVKDGSPLIDESAMAR